MSLDCGFKSYATRQAATTRSKTLDTAGKGGRGDATGGQRESKSSQCEEKDQLEE